MRKILEQRLENAKNDYKCCSFESTLRPILEGQIEAYQDCLNLLPPKRTEQEILKDFEALGWIVSRDDEDDFILRLKGNPTCVVWIDKTTKEYSLTCYLDMQEHKLLNELFMCYGWL